VSDLPDLVGEIEAKARKLYEEVLDPIAARFEFEGSPPASETSGLPMVLFLGNHSSGKSSFINWLAGEDIQRTGIAPIDDGFTLITHGAQKESRDGDAVITDPKLAWGDLKRFGGQLVSHLRLKQVPVPALEGIALIDSPGMIDAADSEVDRGYDFTGVVRWFAERADVILLLFDPDKPGTTGETLKVLTESLAGIDHKLLLIFNKVDRFESMRDYARAYGALCWNLSKAIPRKDLPHLYNTYLPGGEATASAIPLADFDRQREEVRHEVERAPYRRVDNIVSRLYQHTRRMRMHVRVLDQLASERLKLRLRYAAMAGLMAIAGGAASWLAYRIAPDDSSFGYGAIGFFLTALLIAVVYGFYRWDRSRGEALPLDSLFERAYARELTLGDEADDLRALWGTVRDRLRRALATDRVFPGARRSDMRKLNKVIEKDIPELRTQVRKAREKQGDVAPPPPAAEGKTNATKAAQADA
jgi:hypothetical protein